MLIFFLDCRSEFTAESLVGALADLGVSPSTFEWELSGIEVGDHHLHFDREEVQGVQAVRFGVHGGIWHVDHPHSPQDHDHTDREDDIPYVQVRRRIETARCSTFVKSHSLGIFHRIASAKGELSKIPVEQIQFRESEALEWLVTAVLSCIGLDQLGLAQIFFRQTNRGEPIGYPSPDRALSPAILSQLSASGPITASPVGAAILAEFAAKFDSPPKLKSTRIGHGLGPNTDQGQSSVLQATLGEAE